MIRAKMRGVAELPDWTNCCAQGFNELVLDCSRLGICELTGSPELSSIQCAYCGKDHGLRITQECMVGSFIVLELYDLDEGTGE